MLVLRIKSLCTFSSLLLTAPAPPSQKCVVTYSQNTLDIYFTQISIRMVHLDLLPCFANSRLRNQVNFPEPVRTAIMRTSIFTLHCRSLTKTISLAIFYSAGHATPSGSKHYSRP